MARWSPDARQRLEAAAMDLFQERGFADTTVPDIAARAGLTTRTFFRHFADKREVIFAGGEPAAFAARVMAEAPSSASPWEVLVEGLRVVAESRFEGRRAQVRTVRDIIRTDPGLQERDLRKRADLAVAVRDGFLARGLDAVTAALLAETSIAVLHIALDEWLDRDDEPRLHDVIVQALERLHSALSEPTG